MTILLAVILAIAAYLFAGLAYVTAWGFTPAKLMQQICDEDPEFSRELAHTTDREAAFIGGFAFLFYSAGWPLHMVLDLANWLLDGRREKSD